MSKTPYKVWRKLTKEEAEWIDHMRMAKTCASKVPFETYEDALRGAIRTQLDLRNKKRKPLRAYQCTICQLWHLTSKPLCAGPLGQSLG